MSSNVGPRRGQARLRAHLAACTTVLALSGCGGGGGGTPEPEPVPEALREGPHLNSTAAGTVSLGATTLPSDASAYGYSDVQAFLAADGRATLRSVVHYLPGQGQPYKSYELVWSRSSSGSWGEPERLEAAARPESWQGNDAGWLSASREFEAGLPPDDSDARPMGPGVGQALRTARRNAPATGTQRLGTVLDDQGTLHPLDLVQPTAADSNWRLMSTRVAADGTTFAPRQLFERPLATQPDTLTNVPTLSKRPTTERAALLWDEPFIPGDPASLQVAPLSIADGKTWGALASGTRGDRACANSMVAATPAWGTVVTYEQRQADGTCKLRVRVLDGRYGGSTSISDHLLDAGSDQLWHPPLVSAGPDGELLVIWSTWNQGTSKSTYHVVSARVPPGNLADRSWSWSAPAPLVPEGRLLSTGWSTGLGAIQVGAGGHVVVLTVGTSTVHSNGASYILHRYVPGKGWEPGRQLADGILEGLSPGNFAVTASGKVLVAYVAHHKCPQGTCAPQAHPRVIEID
jgi:hypothetical protein